MSALRSDILGIAETGWNDGNISHEEYQIINSGGDQHQCGEGIKVKKHVTACMLGCWPISDRIITEKILEAAFNVNIIQIYAPTWDHPDEDIEDDYVRVKEVMGCFKSREVAVIMGDWNSKFEDEQQYPFTGKYDIGQRNEREKELAVFSRASDYDCQNFENAFSDYGSTTCIQTPRNWGIKRAPWIFLELFFMWFQNAGKLMASATN